MSARSELNAAMSEAALQDAIVAYAELHHWMVWHDNDSRRNRPGLPDLILVRDGDLVIAELKTERGRLRPEQGAWLGALREVARERGITVVVWRPSQWSDGTIERRLR